MQRKKKVETYDAEDIDYLAPAAAQAPQPSYGAGHMQNGAGCLHAASPSQHAPAPVSGKKLILVFNADQFKLLENKLNVNLLSLCSATAIPSNTSHHKCT